MRKTSSSTPGAAVALRPAPTRLRRRARGAAPPRACAARPRGPRSRSPPGAVGTPASATRRSPPVRGLRGGRLDARLAAVALEQGGGGLRGQHHSDGFCTSESCSSRARRLRSSTMLTLGCARAAVRSPWPRPRARRASRSALVARSNSLAPACCQVERPDHPRAQRSARRERAIDGWAEGPAAKSRVLLDIRRAVGLVGLQSVSSSP